jgi:hypothetical protein
MLVQAFIRALGGTVDTVDTVDKVDARSLCMRSTDNSAGATSTWDGWATTTERRPSCP